MSRELTFTPGVAPDISVHDGQVHLVFGPSPWVWLVLSRDGELLGRAEQRVGYYPKTNGVISLAHDGERFVQWTLGVGVDHPPGTPAGVHSTGISPNGTRFFYRLGDGVFTQTGAYREQVALPNAYASYGLWECHDDGTCRTWDENYYATKPPGVSGQWYVEPSLRMDVGEGGSGGIVGAIDTVPFRLWPGENTQWPRCAVAGDLAAICCWDAVGPTVRVWIGTVDELKALGTPAYVLPVVPPTLAGREAWLGYFFALSDRPGYGDNLQAPGNCTVALTDAEAQRSPWPYWAPPGVGLGPRRIGGFYSTPAGTLWPGVAPSDLCLYDGGEALPYAPCPTGYTGLEIYCGVSESVAACEARARAWLGRWPTAPVILIGQAYDRNGLEKDVQKLIDLQGVHLRLLHDYRNIKGLIWFSDGRKGGTRDYELWRPVHAEAARLIRSPWTMAIPTWDCGDLLARFVQRFPVPAQRADELLVDFEQRCRDWTGDFVEQVAYDKPGQGYGRKAQTPTHPVSKDTIARQLDGRVWVWDVLSGVVTGQPTLVLAPVAEDVTGQHFWPVTPQNHLGTPPPPGPDGPPSDDLAQRVAYLEAVLPIYGARIRHIEAQLRALGEAMPV